MNKYKCRLCLEESSQNVEIFKEDFPKMIQLLTGLKVDSNDGLPETSCLQCYKEVKSAMLTRYQIINSHKILLEEFTFTLSKTPNETVVNTVNSLKREVSSSSNDSFVNNKITVVNKNKTLGESAITKDVQNNTVFFSSFSSDKISIESNPEFIEFCVKKDPELENIETDEGTESYEENDSDNSLSSTDADKLIANAENIIEAAKSNPSKTEERAFKKLIRKLQSKEGRAGKSLKRHSLTKKKKKKKEPNKVKFKKRNDPKEADNIYRVKVNYDLKPEHLKYLKSVGKKDRATCPVCSREMYGANLKSHLITHTYDPTPCHLCGKTSKNAQALQDHINYYHKTTPDRFICDQCGKGFRVPCILEKHRKKEHQGPREKPFECHVCGKRFYEKSRY